MTAHESHAARDLALAIRDGVAAFVDDVEVIVSRGDRTSYTVENDAVIPALECDAWSVAMRALRDGRIATAATTSHAPADSIDALRRALGAAQPDPLGTFSVTPSVPDDRRAWDAAAAQLVDAPGVVRRLAVALRDNARAARTTGELVVEAEVSVSRSERAVVTARGEAVCARSTAVQAFVMLDGNDWDAWSSTARPDDVSIADLGRALVTALPAREVTCAEFLGGAKELAVVIHPRLLESLLRSLLLERLAADRVLAGLSHAKPGDVVAHPSFTLVDDPGASASLAGAVCDDEGVAGVRHTLIEGGVLRVMPNDRRAAQALGVAPTGNGYRMPILAEDRAEAPVRVGFSHLDVAAGDTARDALTRGRTVLLTDLLGLHSSNKATGAFNNPIQGGLALEDGVPVARVKPGAWSATGNLHGLLRALTGVSRERLHTGSALLPWVAAPVTVA